MKRAQLIMMMAACATSVAALPAPAQVDPAAAEAFSRMIEAHRDLPAVVVKCKLRISLAEAEASAESDVVEAIFTRVKGGAGKIEIRGYTIHIAGDVIYATHESNPSEFFTLPNIEDAHSALVWDCFGSFDRIPFPHLAIFWGVEDAEELYMQFYGDTPEHLPSGVREQMIDGFAVRTIDFTGPEGRMEINLDPATNLIRSIVHTIDDGPLVPEGVTRTNTFEFQYELPAEVDSATIEFKQGERRPIGIMASLDRTENDDGVGAAGEAGAGALVGEEAPPFLLQTSQGEMIDLARLRGNVVVVDFWATWSPASRNLLPELQNLATWADARGLTVRVLTVNVHDEMGDTPDEKKEAALAFWAEAGYLMPILLDYEGEAQFAYRVSSIPATFVIDPDGFVAMVQESTPDTDPAVYGQALRDEIVRLLEQ